MGSAVDNLAAFLADRRILLGLSQQQLADRLNQVSGSATFTRHEISRYERGRRTPVGRTVGWLAAALETGVADIQAAAAPDNPVADLLTVLRGPALDAATVSRLAYAWQSVPPPQLVERRAGRHVGERLADEVTARTRELRLLDDHLAGLALYPLVDRELRLTLELVRQATYRPTTGRLLFAALADLAQLAGWVCADAGRYPEAGRWHALGVHAAHTADDPALAASALSSLAYQLANTGDPHGAVLPANAAVRGARDCAPVARALFADRQAWSYARIGDHRGAQRALDDADELFAAGGETPGFAYWLNRTELTVMRGRVLLVLGRYPDAVDLLAEAVAGYPDDRAREAALYRSYLVEAVWRGGDHGTARQLATTLTAAGSARVAGRLAQVRALTGAP
jgi:transcriptional regulator with XRE-family HTH domain